MTDLFEKLDSSKKKQTGTDQEFLPLDFFEDSARKQSRQSKKSREEKKAVVTVDNTEKAKPQTVKVESVPEQVAGKVETAEDAASEKPELVGSEEKIEKIAENIEIIKESPLSIDKTGDIDNPDEQTLKKGPEIEISVNNTEKIIEKKNPVVQETHISDKSADKADYHKSSRKSDAESAVSDMTVSHNISKKTVNEAGKSNMSHIKPVRSMGSLTGKDTSVGQTLHEAREAKGLSHIDVEKKTKIKAEFIRLLENDDLSRLPPMVYIVAYIKTLCTVYDIPQEDAMLLVSSVRRGKEAPVLTEDVAKNLEPDKHVNPETKAKNKKILTISIIIGVVALIWIIGIVFLISHKGKKTTTAKPELKPAAVTTALKDTPTTAKTTKPTAVKPAPAPAPAPVKPAPAKTPEQPKDKDIKKDSKKKNSTEVPKPVEKPVVKFSGTELEKFIPPQTLAMSELPIDGKVAKK